MSNIQRKIIEETVVPILHYLFRNKYVNKRIILILDLLICLFSSAWAYISIQYFLEEPLPDSLRLKIHLSAALLISLVLSFAFGLFRGIVRHSSFYEASKIFYFSIIKSILLLLYLSFLGNNLGVSFFVSTLDGLSTFFLLLVFRSTVVTLFRVANGTANKSEPAFIMGANSESIHLSERINSMGERWKIIGFLTQGTDIDLKSHKSLKMVAYKDVGDFIRILRKYRVNSVFFPDEHSYAENHEIAKACLNKKNKIKIFVNQIPALQETAQLRYPMRQIVLDDLLGRTPIFLNMRKIEKLLKEKTILVTGAAGSIGSEIARQISKLRVKQLIMYDIAESPLHEIRLEIEEKYPLQPMIPIIGDVCDEHRLDYVMRRFKPDYIFHAAAYKHVPLMEDNPCEAALNNIIGTKLIAQKAVEYNVEKMVMVSTDKAVNPTNVMGASKRAAEMVVQAFDSSIKEGKTEGVTQFVTTRFGNVLGSNGSVVPLFRRQIESGGPVTVTHPEITRFFMTIPEACQLVLEAAAMGNGGEIYVFKMGDSIKIADMAKRMIRLAGYEPDKDIKIAYTGLRPGKKLYEEVLDNEENTDPTQHSKILIARSRKQELLTVMTALEKIEEAALMVNQEETVRLMKLLIPEFQSKNSIYQKLDIQTA